MTFESLRIQPSLTSGLKVFSHSRFVSYFPVDFGGYPSLFKGRVTLKTTKTQFITARD